jgi:hypothetical protein
MASGIQGAQSISSDMMAQMREKMFERLDGDGDGQIDLAALQQEMEARSGSAPDEVSGRPDPFADLYEALTAANVNGDGRVSREEFDSMELPPPPGPPPDREKPDLSSMLYSEDATAVEQNDPVGMLLDQLG